MTFTSDYEKQNYLILARVSELSNPGIGLCNGLSGLSIHIPPKKVPVSTSEWVHYSLACETFLEKRRGATEAS